MIILKWIVSIGGVIVWISVAVNTYGRTTVIRDEWPERPTDLFTRTDGQAHLGGRLHTEKDS